MFLRERVGASFGVGHFEVGLLGGLRFVWWWLIVGFFVSGLGDLID